ncbi:DUF2971 domain-containing protein [Saliphagus sp. GCM10025334]
MSRLIPHVVQNEESVPLIESDKWNPPQPKSDEKIWRYRSLGQFVTLLDREKLWFSRSDNFDDPYEGSVPPMNIHDRRSKYDEGTQAALSDTYRSFRLLTYLNCWHMNNHESDAMWRLYTDGRGVAIISTPESVKKSLENTDDLEFGEVTYIDYSKETICEDSTIAPYYHKRNGFRHEQEYRILYRDLDKFPENGVPYTKLGDVLNSGKQMSVDVDTLIEKILIGPTAPEWLHSTVKSITEKYGYEFEIESSELNQQPQF